MKRQQEELRQKYAHARYAAYVARMSEADIAVFFVFLFQDISKEWAERTLPIHIKACYGGQWDHIDTWMERTLIKHPKRTPKAIAEMALFYHRIDRRMMPLMIKMAQRVKMRLAVRRLRQES